MTQPHLMWTRTHLTLLSHHSCQESFIKCSAEPAKIWHSSKGKHPNHFLNKNVKKEFHAWGINEDWSTAGTYTPLALSELIRHASFSQNKLKKKLDFLYCTKRSAYHLCCPRKTKSAYCILTWGACHETFKLANRSQTTDRSYVFQSLLIPHILLISLFCVFQVSGAQATQCQPLFASNTQQHHPQSGSSNSPSAGWSVEHGADGNLSGRSRRVHGCGGDSGAKPVRSHWWRDSRNRTLPATGTAGGGGGQGELNMGLHYIKLSLQWLIFDFVAF